MKLFSLPEPELQFARAAHICPRAGIAHYSVYDSLQQTRRERIHVGAVGKQSFTVAHAVNAQADRTFFYVCLG